MKADSSAFLKSLSTGVLPPGIERAPSTPPETGGIDFASLLSKAQSGEIGSGLPIRIGADANVKLSEEQLGRIARAVDLAESSGANTAVVLLDNKAFKVDVHTRTVLGEVNIDGRVETGIDAVVRAPGNAKEKASVVTLPPPGGASENPTLLKVLGERGQNAA